MTWTAIIPSRSDTKVTACIKSLRAIQPGIAPEQIVIVSDGLSHEMREALDGVTWVDGKSQFVFAEAVNAGAAAAGNADLLICGDDVRFTSPLMVDQLQSRARPRGVAAVVPEIVGACGLPEQRAGSTETLTDWITFICVYIPRAAWDAVGGLDERFKGYGCDDLDWSLRALAYGPLVIDHGVSVTHEAHSSYRSLLNWQHLYEQNKVAFRDKYREVMA